MEIEFKVREPYIFQQIFDTPYKATQYIREVLNTYPTGVLRAVDICCEKDYETQKTKCKAFVRFYITEEGLILREDIPIEVNKFYSIGEI